MPQQTRAPAFIDGLYGKLVEGESITSFRRRPSKRSKRI